MSTKRAMSSAASTAQEQSPQAEFISWEAFQQEYLTREDGYKYEWLAGSVEKTPSPMNAAQLYILKNLLTFFRQLLAANTVAGELIPESDLFFAGHHRRPDICWLTDAQIRSLARGEEAVPAFLIEIISTHDELNKVVSKMQDYRAAGVQTVWHILPAFKEVHVYSDPSLTQMAIFKGTDKCSAAPALPVFQLPVADIFYLPEG
ncbi:MAG: Uma2 family endonuclease [Bacteroidetes bacterium]|nr:Uma2 family endonuclease [Bacteroidota bacterium]